MWQVERQDVVMELQRLVFLELVEDQEIITMLVVVAVGTVAVPAQRKLALGEALLILVGLLLVLQLLGLEQEMAK
jgi:hypothetical protein